MFYLLLKKNLMENLNEKWKWLKSLPLPARIIVILCIAAIVVIASMSLSACGTMTSATVRNIQPDSSTTIQISNNTHQTTDVDVNPIVSHGLANETP